MKKYFSIFFALIAVTVQSQTLYFNDYDLLGKNDKIVTNVTFEGLSTTTQLNNAVAPLATTSALNTAVASLVPTNRTITIGTQVGSLQSNLVFESSGGGVTEPTVTNIAKSVVDANVPTLAQSANSGGFAGTETITPLNIVMGGYWKALFGDGISTIDPFAYGASQSGINEGTQTIGNYAYGAIQSGLNGYIQSIGDNSYGASQSGQNGGSQTIGNYAHGASQSGQNGGSQMIGIYACGAIQSGLNDGTQTIGNYAYGSMQRGALSYNSSATNNASGAVQIFSLTNGQHALTTADGAASLLVGAGTISNKNTIVVGDDEYSHGVGSITAGGGFFGSGTGITIGGTNIQDVINQRVEKSGGTATNLSVSGTLNLNGEQVISAAGVTNVAISLQQLFATNYYTKAEIDATSSAPYKAWTGTIIPVNGTATVTYAHGNMPTLTITSPTYITLDHTGFASNGVSRVSLSLYSGTNAVTFNTNLITFATAPTISTNCWNSILIRRAANCIWKGVGL